MAFKTFAPGVLTSSDVNTFLMRQSVIVCTAATRPSSPNEGMVIYETDTDLFQFWNGSAFKPMVTNVRTAYTPTVGGTGWALGNGTSTGFFSQYGNLVFFTATVVFGSTSTFGGGPGGLEVGLPIARASGNIEFAGRFVDTSIAGQFFGQGIAATSTSVCEMNAINSTFANGRIESVINTKPFTWANGDSAFVAGSYVVA
jgi:hypothetical protein